MHRQNKSLSQLFRALGFFCVCSELASAQTVGSDETDLLGVIVRQEPFFSVTATVPSSQLQGVSEQRPDRSDAGYEIHFLMSPSGDVEGLSAYSLEQGSRRPLCDPIPVRLLGPPPRTIYLIPIGCGGSGGGGMLSTDTLIVEFSPDAVDPERDTPIPFGLSVQEVLEGQSGESVQMSLDLPTGIHE